MVNRKAGIFWPVLSSILFMPLAGTIVMITRLRNIRYNGSLTPGEIIWKRFFLGFRFWAIIMLFWGVIVSSIIIADDDFIKNIGLAWAVFFLIYYAFPFIANGVMIILYGIFQDRYDNKARSLIKLVSDGVFRLEDLKNRLSLDRKSLVIMIHDLEGLDLLSGTHYSDGDDRLRPNDRGSYVEYSWKCLSCGANNAKTAPKGSKPACEYCGTPRES